MAMFNAEAILARKSEKEHELTLEECFKIPEGEPVPSITIQVNAEIRKFERRIRNKYNTLELEYRGEGAKGRMINDPIKYCQEIIKRCYIDSQDLMDNPSKSLLLDIVEQKEDFAVDLASVFIAYFKGAEKAQKDQDELDEKN